MGGKVEQLSSMAHLRNDSKPIRRFERLGTIVLRSRERLRGKLFSNGFWVGLIFLAIGSVAHSQTNWPQEFFETHCYDCHQLPDASGGIVLGLDPPSDWSRTESPQLYERVLKAIRDHRMPPMDAAQPSAAERHQAIESLHEQLMRHSSRGGTLLRRLSRLEYRNSIRAIFGIDYELPDGFPRDHTIHGFDNAAAGLVVSAPLMDAYYQAAISIADQIIPPREAPAVSRRATIAATDLVISYSSGVVIDGAMRLAARTSSMWRSCTWPEKFEVQRAGTYLITIDASRFAPGSVAWPDFSQPMKLQVYARSLEGKDGDPIHKQRFLAEFDITSETPESVKLEAELFPSETPVFYFANAPLGGDQSDKADLAATLRQMFANDPRLLAGWLGIERSNSIRGGLGWDRVKEIRDSPELDLSQVDLSDTAIDKLIKEMTSNITLYTETVVYQLFEEGPALQIHEVQIEGPRQWVESPEQRRQAAQAKAFLGTLDLDSASELEVRTWLNRFLSDAFRRPIAPKDVDEYAAIVMSQVDQGHDLRSGLHLAIRTALMSPKFLYRAHQAGRLDDYDLASRLAYFLTVAPPDPALLQAASRGELANPKRLAKHARRLLTAPERSEFISDFTAQWLGTRELEDIMPDERLMPKFTADHREAMVRETEWLLVEILQNNLPLTAFIQPGFAHWNQALAQDIYGREDLQIKGRKLVRVEIPDDSPYGGLLGQAGVMMATANGVDTQPIVRGVWVLENILGDPPPPPPENVPALTPDTRGATTVREMLAAHRSDASCASCHQRIDPLGFVLENFDPVGRWRTHYPEFKVNAKGKTVITPGQEIDAASDYPGVGRLANVHELRRFVLAHIDQFGNCLAEKLVTYATGRTLSYAERHELHRCVADTLAQNEGFQDLLVRLVQTETFRTK